jgi:hypothetical protein
MDLGPGWDDALRAWRRMTRRVSHDVGSGLETLADLSAVRRQLEHVELAAVRAARSHGRSWAEIATHLGITRQSAWERWRELDAEEDVLDAVVDDAVQDLVRREKGKATGQVEVPNVIGLSCGDARELLMAAGLTALLHNVGGKPLPLAATEGVVTDQVPKAGSRRRTGSSVTVWVHRGGEAGVREPRRPRPRIRSATAENS